MKTYRTLGGMGLVALGLISGAASLISCGKTSTTGTTGTTTTAAAGLTLSPTSGPVGTLVNVTGADFSTVQTVDIGGVAAVPISSSSTTLTAYVMPGTPTGVLTVKTAGGGFASSGSFAVTATGVPTTQQGSKLVGTGAVGAAKQGYSSAISADGNTALVSGSDDNSSLGATWVYVRSGGAWTQQGAKLVGTGAVGNAGQGGGGNEGGSIALSADGNTALIGGSGDNSTVGAAWVFTRSDGVWTQQGAKLVGTKLSTVSVGFDEKG